MTNGKRYFEGVNPNTGQAVKDSELDFDFRPKRGVLYCMCLAVCKILTRIVFPAHVEGRENIPRRGGVIFAVTHIGTPDGVVANCLCRRRAYCFAKIELFKKPSLKFLFRRLGCIPIDRSKRNSRSLDLAEDLLKKGGALTIFPEGTRNKTPQIRPLKFGAVSLAARANVPIVPVVTTGRYKLFRRSLQVEFTAPIPPNRNLEKANQALQNRLQTVRDMHIKSQATKFRQSDGWLQVALKPLLLVLVKIIYRPQVVGASNVPKNGAVIVAANHKHDFDPFLIMMSRPARRFHFLAKRECVDWKIGRIINKFGVIFVDRAARDKDFVNYTVLKMLSKSRAVALFPEGTRNKTDKILISFKFGAVSYAQKSGAPLVPAAIVGRYRPFRKGLKIVFGQPIKVSATSDLAKTNQKLYKSIEKVLLAGGESTFRPEIYKEFKERNHK
ncbi:MAG: 1-acyl-sn-glycerol-3-phosphate acyltransferase [Candidatus Nomurabacteria bacterium]|jgi:1-acyl-sn-glycerol-3-phosphate acyltransferase|nr:1-acyl-sn-glycerol-3-phosphate acyltransferase [Candidatus Nomurabacteria bacterium]